MAIHKIDFVGVISSEQRVSYMTGVEIPTVNAISIKQKLADLAVAKGDTVELQMHCFGGDVQEGHYIMSLFEDAGVVLDVNILGCAYSEATYFVAKSNKTRMSSNGHFMIHNIRGGNYGTANELKATVKDIEDYDNLLCDVLAKKSGKTIEYIKDNYLDGKSDKGLTPQQAFEEGFVNEVYNGASITFQNNGYSKFMNSYFDNVDENAKDLYYSQIRKQIKQNMATKNTNTPISETQTSVTPDMLAILAEKENGLREEISELTIRLSALQNEKEGAAKKYSDLLADKDSEIAKHLQIIGGLTQDKNKLANEVKETKIANKVFAAVAVMKKQNGLPLDEFEVNKFKEGFITMYKVDEVNDNFVVTSRITNEVQKMSLWDCVQGFCTEQNSKLFNVQKGTGYQTNSTSTAYTGGYSAKTRETLFAEAKQRLLAKYNAGSPEYYRNLIKEGFADQLANHIVEQFS